MLFTPNPHICHKGWLGLEVRLYSVNRSQCNVLLRIAAQTLVCVCVCVSLMFVFAFQHFNVETLFMVPALSLISQLSKTNNTFHC